MNIPLFPNTHDRDNRIKAGETIVIGRLGELEIRPPYGKDVITVVGIPQTVSRPEGGLTAGPRQALYRGHLNYPRGYQYALQRDRARRACQQHPGI